MHDPMTLAFRIRSPFRKANKLFPEGWRETLVEVWHRDPETDGSDNSCGWSYPRLTDAQRKTLRSLAWCEAYRPWFQRVAAKSLDDHAYMEPLMRGAILHVAHALEIPMTWDQVCYEAARHIHAPEENFHGGFCFLPGYHSNVKQDRREDREDSAYGLFCGIASHLLRQRRHWWRHPRWHVHHWRVEFPVWGATKCWLFTRCDKCGGRFRFGETGIAGDRGRVGFGWFRPEPLTHVGCHTREEPASAQQHAPGAHP